MVTPRQLTDALRLIKFLGVELTASQIGDIDWEKVSNIQELPVVPDSEEIDFAAAESNNYPDWGDTLEAYDYVAKLAKDIMVAKNHDYGDVWREMRASSITDEILIKVKRIKRLEDLCIRGEKAKVSEGIESEYRDIVNYAIFGYIRRNMGE